MIGRKRRIKNGCLLLGLLEFELLMGPFFSKFCAILLLSRLAGDQFLIVIESQFSGQDSVQTIRTRGALRCFCFNSINTSSRLSSAMSIVCVCASPLSFKDQTMHDYSI